MPQQWSQTRAVLIGGAIAGTLDLLFAISFAYSNGTQPQRLLQIIASGLLGESSYAAGTASAAMGFAIHFVITFAFATAYVVASRRVEWLRRNFVVAGLAFGIVVFLLMRLVALPLSAFPHPVNITSVGAMLDLISHMFLFGLPIAIAARKVIR